MSIATLAKRTQQFLSDNSPTLLTGAGIVGTVATTVLVGRASFRHGHKTAIEQITELGMLTEENQKKLAAGVTLPGDPKERFKKQVSDSWKMYVPGGAVGVATVTSIALSNRISTGRTAALAAAMTITDKAFSDYRAKVVETIGEKKEQTDVRDKVMQDRVNETGDRGSLVILNNGDVLCYDAFTDRYFNSTMEKLKKAQNDTNYELLHSMYVSLSDFYERIGLPRTAYSDEIGWTSSNQVELHFSSVMTPDDRPALAFTFHVNPVRGYDKVHG